MSGWVVKENSTIYAIRCIHNGKIYIGRTQNIKRRLREHFLELTNKSGKYSPKEKKLQMDFDEYGVSGFEVHILEEDVTPDEVCEREAYWIAEYRATDPRYGYNRDPGTTLGGFPVVRYDRPPKMWQKKTGGKA